MSEEIKKLIVDQGQAFEEFKRKNDELIQAKADGKAVGDLTADVAKINEGFTEIRKQLVEIEKKAGRPEFGGERDEKNAEAKAAFDKFLRKGEQSLNDMERKAMNRGSDPDGGYLILPEMDAIITRVAPTVSAVYRLANQVTIGTNRYEKLVKTSGMKAARVAEGGAGGESTAPKYSKIMIDAATAEVEPWVYNETLEDAFVNLEADLANEAGISFAALAGTEFITGDGVNGARGITGYDAVANASYAWGKVGYIVSGKASAFASVAPADKVVSLQHALKSVYRPNAVWLCNDATLGTMRQLKDGSGSYYLWQPDPAAGFGGRFLGSPVEVDDNVADIGANSYSLAYGDFRQGYTVVNRAGVTVIRDNITAKGTTKFNFRKRFGGAITNFEAIKLMKFATS